MSRFDPADRFFFTGQVVTLAFLVPLCVWLGLQQHVAARFAEQKPVTLWKVATVCETNDWLCELDDASKKGWKP